MYPGTFGMFLRSTCTSLHVHTCTLSFSVSFQNMCMFNLLVYTTKHQHLGPNHPQWLQSYHVDLVHSDTLHIVHVYECMQPPTRTALLHPTRAQCLPHLILSSAFTSPLCTTPHPPPPFPLTCSYNSHSRSRTWCTLSFYDAPCVSFRHESPSPPISFSPRTSTVPVAPSTPMSAPP